MTLKYSNSGVATTVPDANGTNATGTWNINISGNAATVTNGVYTTDSGTVTTTMIAAVNSNVGTFGSGTQVGTFTVNAKGQITAASNTTITGTSPGGIAGGDLSGSYPNPTVAKINGVSLGSTTATSGNLLIGSGTNWVSNAVTGDITIGSTGVTAIGNLKVTNAMIANSTIDLTAKVTGILPNANTTATSSNTASAIVARDGSGNFSAGSITAINGTFVRNIGVQGTQIIYGDSNAGVDNKYWNIFGSGNTSSLYILDDSKTTGSPVWTITRTDATSALFEYWNTTTVNYRGLSASTLLALDSSKNVINASGTYAISISGTAANATNTAITDDTTTNATMYPTWVTSTTGNLPQKVSSSKLTFNPSSGTLTTTTFSGSFSGNASTATALQTARNIGAVSFNGTADIVPQTIQTVDDTTNSTQYPLFAGSSGSVTSGQQPKTSPGYKFNPSFNSFTINANQTDNGGIITIMGGLAGSEAIYFNLDRANNGYNAANIYSVSSSIKWYAGLISGNDNYRIRDADNTIDVLSITAGATPVSTFTGTVNLSSLSASSLLAVDGSKNIINASGTYSISISGNAATATILQNARTIGGVSFNGSANIVPQTIESANEASDTTCFPLFITASGTQQLQPKNNTGFTYNSSTNNVGATTFTGALAGNATTASSAAALTTPRTIGAVSFDGTANIVPQTIQTVDDTSDTTCFVAFVNASGTQSSGQQPKTNSGLTYNASNNTIGFTNVTCDNINNRQITIPGGWTDTGETITITAITTNPTYAASFSKIFVKRIGDSVIMKYEFERSSGTAGSGNYLIALPTGYAFASSVPVSTASATSVDDTGLQRALVGYGHIGTGSARGSVSCFAYDTTHFRVGGIAAYTGYTMFGSSFYQLSSACGFGLILTFPVSGFSDTQRFSSFTVS